MIFLLLICPVENLYTPPVYKLKNSVLFHSQEKEIMKEIMDNGPVQGMG